MVINRKAVVHRGWVVCPLCGRNIIKANKDTSFYNLPLFCKRCKQEIITDLDSSRVVNV